MWHLKSFSCTDLFRLTATAILLLLVSASPAFGQTCVEDLAGLGTLNCTANDVTLALVDSSAGGVPSCAPGDLIDLNLLAVMEAGAATRYDIGISVATDGGDAFTGGCNYYNLPAPLATCANQVDCTVPLDGVTPFWDGESASATPSGDLCGDLDQGVQTSYDLGTITVTCQDLWTIPAGYNPATDSLCYPGRCAPGDLVLLSGGDGKLDPIGAVVSWDNQDSSGAPNSPHCLDPSGALPSTRSKCNGSALVLAGDVFVESPGINLVKVLQSNADEDSSGTISLGDTLTYGFTVTNTGNVALDPVSVTDPMIPAISCGATSLAPSGEAGDSTTCTGTYVVTQGDVDNGSISNTGTASGTSPSGATVTDQDTAVTQVPQSSAIGIVKSFLSNADEDGSGSITANDTLTYQFVASNAGNVTLTSVTVTDPLPGLSALSCTPAQPATLIPGGSMTCTATYSVTQADVDAGVINNTATVAGNDPGGSPVTDTDNETVQITRTAVITLLKALFDNADEDGSGTVTLNDTLTYQFVANNPGNVTLTNVTVTDPLSGLSALSCTPAQGSTLAPGASMICTATYVVAQADVDAGAINNTGTATGLDPSQNQVSNSNSEIVSVAGDTDQGFTKTMTSNADEDGSGTVSLNDTLTYTFVATNTGDVTLSAVSISDPLPGLSALNCTPVQPTTLTPGEVLTCTATYSVTQTDVDAGVINNTATVTFTPPDSEPQTAQDSEAVPIPTAPVLSLVKTMDSNADEDGSGTVSLNDTLTYQFVASNLGNVTLTNVTITDPFPGLSALSCTPVQPATLAPGEAMTCTATYVVTQVDVDAGSINNTATAEGVDPQQAPLSSEDSETVQISTAATITLVKTMTNNADEDGSGSVTLNDTLTYEFVGTNTGDVTLSNVTASDPLPGLSALSCTPAQPATLEPGDTITCTATYTVVQADMDAGMIENTATVTGTPPTGEPVSDTGSENVATDDRGLLELTKVPDVVLAGVGDVITYTFTVTNTGNVTLTGLVLTDDILGAVTLAGTELAPGATTDGTATHTVTAGDLPGPIVNTGVVTGDTPSGLEVTASANAEVALEEREIEPAPIPTLSEWGLILLTALLALVGMFLVGRRQRPA